MKTHVSSYRLDVRLWRHGATTSAPLYPFEFQTQKTLSAASGSWALQLGPSRLPVPWQEIPDNDWVSIVLEERASRTRSLLMWGPIDSVRESSNAVESGLNQKTIAISGRDFAKPLQVSELLFDTYLQNSAVTIPGNINTARYAALANLLQTNRQVTPASAAARLLDVVLRDWLALPAALGGQYLGNILHYASDVARGQVLSLAGYVPNGNTAYDAYFRRLFSTPFHDWWYDLRPAGEGVLVAEAANTSLDRAVVQARLDRISAPAKAPISFLEEFGLAPTITFRNLPSPFGDATGAHALEGFEELSADVGRSGAERFTILSTTGPSWAANLASGTFGSSGGRLPVFDNDGTMATEIAKHGLRYLELPDILAPNARFGPEQRPPIEWLIDRVRQAYELYAVLPEALSGSVRLSRVRPEIRVGDVATREGYRYRVEQVSHSGRVQDSGLVQAQSTLAISRGVKIGRKPPAIPPAWTR